MPIQRVGVFTLDTSNERFYTLCGRVHVKLALTIIVFFLICLELSEWIAYVTVDDIGERTDWAEALMSILQLVMVVCMALGLVMEQAFLLVPFILFMFLSVTSFLIWVFQCIIWVFAPYSKNVNELFGFNDETGFYYREKCIFMLLAVLVTFTTMFSWWLQIGLVCYQYFESRQNELKTKLAAQSVRRPPLVDTTSGQTTPKPSDNGLSFPNQTFTIADDEDEDDNVFENSARSDPLGAVNNTSTVQPTSNKMSFSNQNFKDLEQQEEDEDDDDDEKVFERAKGPNMV